MKLRPVGEPRIGCRCRRAAHRLTTRSASPPSPRTRSVMQKKVPAVVPPDDVRTAIR